MKIKIILQFTAVAGMHVYNNNYYGHQFRAVKYDTYVIMYCHYSIIA